MTQEITDNFWQAEARTQQTKQFIRDIKRITCRKFTAEEKIRICITSYYNYLCFTHHLSVPRKDSLLEECSFYLNLEIFQCI